MRFRIEINGQAVEGLDYMATLLPLDQQVRIVVVGAADQYGNVVGPVENIRFSTSDETLVTFGPAPDGNGYVGVPVGQTLGANRTCQLQLVGDADLGEGVQDVTGIADVELTAGAPATIATTVTVEPQA